MSIVSQAAVVLLIIITGFILRYAYIGLANAAEEGEHFVDEWAIRQQKREENRHKNPFYKRENDILSDDSGEPSSMDGALTVAEAYQGNHLNNAEDLDENQNAESKKPDMPYYSGKPGNSDSMGFQLRFPQSKMYRLVLLDENKKRTETYALNHFPYRIGRDQSNDLVLNDLYVARYHCEIVEEGEEMLVKDLNSSNKIFVDGEIAEELALSDGQHFYVGGCEFLFEEVHGGR